MYDVSKESKGSMVLAFNSGFEFCQRSNAECYYALFTEKLVHLGAPPRFFFFLLPLVNNSLVSLSTPKI